ncbi:sigma-70 family RNA polymerase sigma factor [Streptomyces sp. NPDC020096]
MTQEEFLAYPPAPPMTPMPLDLAAFHQTHRPAYVRWSERYLGSRQDAEEAVDQTFEELARTWTSVLSKENPAAYAWTMMKNRTIDYARARGRRPVLCEAEVFDTVGLRTAIDPMEAIQDNLTLTQALSSLSDRQRDVFFLRHREGFSVADVAFHLGITKAGVRSIDRYARRHLRQALAPEREGEHP